MAEHPGSRGGLWIAAVALALVSCGPGAGAPESGTQSTPPRAGRFGSLRDFVLFDLRSVVGRGGERALFVDRFEVTRGDWQDFAFTPEGKAVDGQSAAMTGDSALPVGRISLRQARAFARWRFARLPRWAEWVAVVRGDNRYKFPWGSYADATRANTAELGLFEPTPVGTFESGRRSVGQPYDLIGNVSEWTETVPVEWCLADRQDTPSVRNQTHRGVLGAPALAVWQLLPGILPLLASAAPDDIGLRDSASLLFAAGRRKALSTPALAVWQPMPGVVPGITVVACESDLVPRLVVGADFQYSMQGASHPVLAKSSSERVLGGDRRDCTGVRLVTAPAELLAALVAAEVQPTELDYEQLSRFVAREGHRAALTAAFAEVAPHWTPAENARPLARWLREHLGS